MWSIPITSPASSRSPKAPATTLPRVVRRMLLLLNSVENERVVIWRLVVEGSRLVVIVHPFLGDLFVRLDREGVLDREGDLVSTGEGDTEDVCDRLGV